MRFFMESSFFLSKLKKKRYAFLHLLLFFIGIFRVISVTRRKRILHFSPSTEKEEEEEEEEKAT